MSSTTTFEDIFVKVSRMGGYGTLAFGGSTNNHDFIKGLINDYDKKVSVLSKGQRRKDTQTLMLQNGVIEYDLPSGTDKIDDMYVIVDETQYYLEEITKTVYERFKHTEENHSNDQTQLNSDGTQALGITTSTEKVAQQFVPTEGNLKGVTFQVGTLQVGGFTGNITVSIQKDDGSDAPDGTDIISYEYTNQEFSTLTLNEDIFCSLRTTLNVGAKYWIVFTASTTIATTGGPELKNQSSNPYTSGLQKNYNGTVWSADTGNDLYFKTNYRDGDTDIPQYFFIEGDKIKIYPVPDKDGVPMIVNRWALPGTLSLAGDYPVVKDGYEDLLVYGPLQDIFITLENRGLYRDYKRQYDEMMKKYQDEVNFPTDSTLVKYDGQIPITNPNHNPHVTAS